MKSIQYTIRDLEPEVDRVLRHRAREEGKSLNMIVKEALRHGAGLAETPVRNPEFDDLAGRWVEDRDCDAALEAMRETIDEEVWR